MPKKKGGKKGGKTKKEQAAKAAEDVSIFDEALREAAEVEFTNAFNDNRFTLTGFAKSHSKSDLHCVRDGFFLGMARSLCLPEYEPVKKAIVEDFRVAAAAGTAGGFQQTIDSARNAEGWAQMVKRLFEHAEGVGSDLMGIWMGLETGRLQWLTATAACHKLKCTLKNALKLDGGTEGDVTDSKMVWMYALATTLPPCENVAETWGKAVQVKQPSAPLKGYKPELWDPRKEEWAPLDLAVQAAAERAGTSLDEAWDYVEPPEAEAEAEGEGEGQAGEGGGGGADKIAEVEAELAAASIAAAAAAAAE